MLSMLSLSVSAICQRCWCAGKWHSGASNATDDTDTSGSQSGQRKTTNYAHQPLPLLHTHTQTDRQEHTHTHRGTHTQPSTHRTHTGTQTTNRAKADSTGRWEALHSHRPFPPAKAPIVLPAGFLDVHWPTWRHCLRCSQWSLATSARPRTLLP